MSSNGVSVGEMKTYLVFQSANTSFPQTIMKSVLLLIEMGIKFKVKHIRQIVEY